MSTSEMTAGQRRIAAAQATRRRNADEKKAIILRAHGWTVIAPEEFAEFTQAIRSALRQP
jgi:hypothetical protein